MSAARYDVLAFAAHPDDLEAVMGGTAAKLARKGRSMLFVDLCDGEPARYAEHGQRGEQATQAAAILGVDRFTLPLRDRLIRDTTEVRLAVACLSESTGRVWCSRPRVQASIPITRPSPRSS